MNDHKSKGCKQTYSTGLSVWDFNFEGKRKIDHNPRRLGFCFILVTELKQEMFDPETKGCKLGDRRNVSFSSCRCKVAFLFSETLIKLNVNLITSNQFSDVGEVADVQTALVGRVQRTEHWVAN
jgi:hypothetical protein